MGASSMKEHGSWARFGIKLLATVVLLGHMMMWIMMPTRTFLQDWLNAIHAVVSPTYFGKLGANTLIYTFPVMLIATLGCVYLHLGAKSHEHNTKRHKNSFLDSWKRPALVKGPLGIVSWIELSFLTMFVVLLVWFFYSFHKTFSGNEAQDAARKGLPLWKVTVGNTGFVFGLVGHVCLSFLFFPVSRGSSVLQLFGLTSESSIKYHIWLGHMAMVVLSLHGLFSIAAWAFTNTMSEMFKWDTIHISNVAGEVSLLAGLVMWATSLPIVRRKFFELFLYTHYLYVVFMVFYVFHVGFPYACITIAGFFLFLIDRYLRFLQSKQRVRLVSARVLPCRVVELNFRRSSRLVYNPTSVLFLNVPGVSRLQWHPFTVSSSCGLDSEVVSVVVKEEGSWSRKLVEKLSSGPVGRVEVALEGPYGPASTHFLSHDALVLVSGGSGITPFISIIRELLFLSTKTNLKTPKILLICAFKTSQDLAILDLILPETTPLLSPSSALDVQIQAYVTRETTPTCTAMHDDQKRAQTLRFEPGPRDSSLGPVLGPNGWLWLGAVVASSFSLFLVLVGLLTQFYIYPIDRNTDEVFSNTWRAAIYMVLMCGSIVVASSVAFLWNKRGNEEEDRKTTSFGSGGEERELESLPRQCFSEVTSVTYGSRPNLKRILLDIEEPRVGVFASGPKKLRQEVAKICASGLADNLHFESISFSW